MSTHAPPHDLLIVGAGINGAGIARDAVGRGLDVLIVEQGDIASATSSWSTKLVHGGLRYLEHFEFRLVRESLNEREVLLRTAPHLVAPLAFVLPHEPHLRPAWMIRAGLFLYDHLGHRERLPGSFGVDLAGTRWGAGLKSTFKHGFVYSDARVDDARLVTANVLAAHAMGATVRVRTRFTGAKRVGNLWKAQLVDAGGNVVEAKARAIVNASGPWVKRVRDATSPTPSRENVRHVKGSHIVVPRVHNEEHAYILQNADKRIVFVIPYHDRFSLIGTTDIPVDDYEHPGISEEETDYLLDLANAYLARPLERADIVWTYSGVRPLYDDGASDPSAITRDYVLKLDVDDAKHAAPALSIFGGKLTTYRKLAEHALSELKPFFPQMKGDWTADAALPGGDMPRGDFTAFLTEVSRRYAHLPGEVVRGMLRRHGSRALDILADVKRTADLGRQFGDDLTAVEIDYFIREEWAMSADDVLWRRTKAGLGMTPAQRNAVATYVERTVAQGTLA
ncbi:MAG TPA: glycerol-3-phosphate dehydrogenase [Casimicrobiaceae bacterium]|nr:glycerol-3-phosphate dehydrogenase [Casimicrobiaceae bacterium]